jgi:RNA polymerase sigma factor (sigma-70 family)
LMGGVRAGNEDAARELVERYEPALRRAIRTPLMRYRLNRVLDAADISQVVLASFFKRAIAGHFQLEEPHQVLRLLVTMARRQILNEARRYRASRRDRRREDEYLSEHQLNSLVDRGLSPSMIAMVNELAEETFRRFTIAERYLVEQRLLGRSWGELSGEIGGSPECVRKRFERALYRVARELEIAIP